MAISITAQKRKIEREIRRLERQAAQLMDKERKPVIEQIVREMRDFGITPEEISNAFASKASKAGRPAKAKPLGAVKAKKPVAPKYRNTKTGETWTGRGRAPRWITVAENAGVSRDAYLITQNEQPRQDAPGPAEAEATDLQGVAAD